ncbi:M23 family metallopeptidase [Nocardioides ferulae]|uniref:M23 family metallopeptidase n=1 Tax=Nocardioides ferulae TaxID=2340821 RepID=UPI000EB4B72C|nr:M23 family metallopeptidase [Nocardioides ferulae]
MRLFPRTARQRAVASFATGAVLLGALASPQANAQDDLKQEQKQVERDLHEAAEELEHSSDRFRRATARFEAARASLAEAQGELDAVRARLDEARARDEQMQVKLEEAVQRLAEAREELASGQAALADQREVVADTVTDIYQQGDPELLAFASLLNAETPADLTHRMQAQDVIVGRETRAYDDLHAAEVLLQVNEDEVEDARDEVAVQRREAAEHLETMRALTIEARSAKQRVREMVVDRRDARAAAAKARQRDQAVLARLKEREQRIKERILRQSRNAAGGYRGATNGLLMRPVDGYVTSPFGYRTHPIYGYYGLHDGTDFGAGCGAPMYAVADGTVMSRYYSSVYGNRLYLNVGQVNGKNLTVVYNHASGYQVGVGQRVRRGQLIGYMGDTGWSTGCHLHFSALQDGNPVNPLPFF